MSKLLKEPKLTFYHDKNDPDDVGSWTLCWGNLDIYLTSAYAKPGEKYLSVGMLEGSDDDTSMFIHGDGTITLGAYGIESSFKDLLKCLSIRRALRLLKDV